MAARHRVHAAAAMAAAVLALSACGGGSSTATTTASTDTPSGAAQATDYATAVPATREEAVRFLTQAGWGGTDSEIDHVMQVGFGGWINEQVAVAPASHRASWDAANAAIKAVNPSQSAWQNEVLYSFWTQVATGDYALRQKVAYALSQIFVISSLDSNVGNDPEGVAGYLDMLASQGLGNYRALIESVSRHPMMGLYLSSLANQKEDPSTGRIPDQNYAREVMQLFSIGLYQLNPDGSTLQGPAGPVDTFGADDVVGMSRVFTGFSWDGPDTDNNRFFGWGTAYQDPNRDWMPMQGYTQYHSTEAKSFLGVSVAAQSKADPDSSMKSAMDALANHPNVGPFIGRQLIQRLVTSNPSPAYVSRVAAAFADNGQGTRGDMTAVVKAVLLDKEARDMTLAADPAYGKLREPVLRLANLLHTFQATSDSGHYQIGTTDDPGTQLGQTPLRAPSVFNFYRPGYVPPNTGMGAAGLTAPEMQITNETTTAGYVNFIRNTIAHGTGSWNSSTQLSDVRLPFTTELGLANDSASLVARLNQILAFGEMPADLLAIVQQGVDSITVPALKADGSNQSSVNSALRNRVNAAVFLTMVSPEYLVQK